jgi:glycosyltransferase involved in cell wall biosynthesis
MLQGFATSLPKTVTLDKTASSDVYMGTPDLVGGWHDAQYRSCFTMWETDTLPDYFLRWLPEYDQILVPCEHNRELFSQHHENVKVVPLGVDHKFWKPIEVEQSETFRFHAGGSLWLRKGLDVAVKAFTALGLPNTELHIKAAPHARDTPTKFPPNVIMHRKWMSAEAQREWFNRADCFIAVSRGEGFGLMPLQAIASGIPTILSDSTGQSQFAHLAFGVVPCQKSPAVTVGRWDEPDQGILEELMVEAYNNRESNKIRAMARITETKEFSWVNATKKLIAAVPAGELIPAPIYRKAVMLMTVKARRKVNAYIGQQLWQMQPGETHEVPEDVCRVLVTSGAVSLV